MNTAETTLPRPPVMETPEGKAAYDARWKRIIDCVELRQPDRMPVALFATFWLAKYGGITCKELMYDYEKTKAIAERAVLEFEPDACGALVSGIASGRSLEAIGFKQLQWPGNGVGDNQPFQYLDREYMFADEYDDFIFDPDGLLSAEIPAAGCFLRLKGWTSCPYSPGLHYFRLINHLGVCQAGGARFIREDCACCRRGRADVCASRRIRATRGRAGLSAHQWGECSVAL